MIQMTPAILMPISIELEKGPIDVRPGNKLLSTVETAASDVPGNVIFKASLCMASSLGSSNMMAEKRRVRKTESMRKVINASKSVLSTSSSPFAEAAPSINQWFTRYPSSTVSYNYTLAPR